MNKRVIDVRGKGLMLGVEFGSREGERGAPPPGFAAVRPWERASLPAIMSVRASPFSASALPHFGST